MKPESDVLDAIAIGVFKAEARQQYDVAGLLRRCDEAVRASRARIAELERDQRLLAEVVQAPFPLHDYCSEEAWTRACHIVAAMCGGGRE